MKKDCSLALVVEAKAVVEYHSAVVVLRSSLASRKKVKMDLVRLSGFCQTVYSSPP